MVRALQQHLDAIRACRQCPSMQSAPVTGQAVYSKVMLVGQAPGNKEPVLHKPFAWTGREDLVQMVSGRLWSDGRDVSRLCLYGCSVSLFSRQKTARR